MHERSGAEAVLITGAFGSGKTSVVEEIADILEGRGVRYGALDLDWLIWFDPGPDGDAVAEHVMLHNVDAVVGNYFETGVRRFALAGAFGSAEEVEALRSTIAMPVTVVRLTVPIEAIERRLATAVTAGRGDDLRVARRWVAESTGEGIEDLLVENDRPIRGVADEILTALGW